MKDKMMICPKAKKCEIEYCGYKHPHENNEYCGKTGNISSGGCPKCVPVRKPQTVWVVQGKRLRSDKNWHTIMSVKMAYATVRVHKATIEE